MTTPSGAAVPSDLIGPKRAGELLGVSYGTVYSMIARGELIAYRVTNGIARLSEAEVRAHVRIGPQSVDAVIDRIVAAAPEPTPEQREKLDRWLAPLTAV
ncbi:excisionase family DNA-binding protein [Streptomyces sp. NPDC007896]|uniref:excisionase family DNA-binding protein n=1 Tax=Streptomyces sp. NPDC007896 TaxID=3364784 RepID=UPI0036F10E0A